MSFSIEVLVEVSTTEKKATDIANQLTGGSVKATVTRFQSYVSNWGQIRWQTQDTVRERIIYIAGKRRSMKKAIDDLQDLKQRINGIRNGTQIVITNSGVYNSEGDEMSYRRQL